MHWTRFICRMSAVTLAYAFVIVVAREVDGTRWQLVSYFVALKETSLIALLIQGIEAVNLAIESKIHIPRWLKCANYLVLFVALVAFGFPMLKALGFVPTQENNHGWAKILRMGIVYAPIGSLVPLFLYTILNMIVINVKRLEVSLRNRIREYFIFADLSCAIPAAGLILLLWLTDGFTSGEAELAVTVGAATLIFVSNAASFAVNELAL